MAKILTDEQRAAKRARDAAYRARKAALKNQPETELTPELESEVFPNYTEPLTEYSDEVYTDPTPLPETPFAIPAPAEETNPIKRAFKALKDKVLKAQVGETVTAPKTGLDATVQKTFRGGGRLLTEDGEHMWANTCPHSTDERSDKGTIIFFEMVGDGNRDFADGTTGQVHRFSRCNKVIA